MSTNDRNRDTYPFDGYFSQKETGDYPHLTPPNSLVYDLRMGIERAFGRLSRELQQGLNFGTCIKGGAATLTNLDATHRQFKINANGDGAENVVPRAPESTNYTAAEFCEKANDAIVGLTGENNKLIRMWYSVEGASTYFWLGGPASITTLVTAAGTAEDCTGLTRAHILTTLGGVVTYPYTYNALRVASKGGAMHTGVQNAAALRLIGSGELSDKMEILVEDLGGYRYDTTSILADDGNFIIKPFDITHPDPGRWIKIYNQLADQTRAGIAVVGDFSGGTTCAITFPVAYPTPTTYAVSIEPGENITHWVSGVSEAGFTINLSAVPTQSVHWLVNRIA